MQTHIAELIEDIGAPVTPLAKSSDKPICTVRITTSQWSDKRGLSQRRDIRYMQQLSRGFNILQDEAQQVGATEAIQKLLDLHTYEDGLYEITTCNESRDWETGYIDDYDFRLIPVDKEREQELRKMCHAKRHDIHNSPMLLKQFIYKKLKEIGPKFLKSEWKKKWTPEHPTTGYCYLISEILHHYYFSNTRPYMVKVNNHNHWFLKNGTQIFDYTAEQFDEPIAYAKAKGAAFYKGSIPTHHGHISKRAHQLALTMGVKME